MPTVSIPGAYIRSWVPGGPSIAKTVSFERTAQAWRAWAPRFAGRLAGAAGGYLGAAALAGSVAYEGYQMYRRRNKRSGGSLGRPGVKRIKRSKYGTNRSRTRYGKRTAARRKFVGRRSTVSGRVVKGRSRMGMRKRRYVSVQEPFEFGAPLKQSCNVGLRGKRFSRRDLKLGYQKVIYRWQRVNTVTDGSTTACPGSLILSHATIGTSTAAPMWIFRLNQTMEQSPGTYTDGPCYSTDFLDNGNVSFFTHSSQSHNGAPVANGDWQYERFDPELTSEPMRYIMNAWYDIRLMLYGCTAQPTVFDVMVISFTRSYLDPLEVPSNSQEAADRHALYQGLVQPYMSNPIMPRVRSVAGYKIHKRIRVSLDPTLDVENDKDPRSKSIKLFVRDGNVYDYRYHDDGFGGAGADDKLSGVQWPLQGGFSADYTTVPAPLARKYLVVRAMNTTRVSQEGQTSANTPSFDIIVRKCEYQQSGN